MHFFKLYTPQSESVMNRQPTSVTTTIRMTLNYRKVKTAISAIKAKNITPWLVSPSVGPSLDIATSGWSTMATQLKNGYTATEVEGEVRDRVEKLFEGQRQGLVRLEPHGWLLPKPFLKYADRLYDFEFKDDDVVIMTFPKNGTTWMQEIVWTMRNNPDLDNPKGKTPIEVRSPFLDLDMMIPLDVLKESGPLEALEDFTKSFPERNPEDGVFLQFAELDESPRTLKIHLPFSFVRPELLQKAKTVIVVRNPKDVCVSYHHHCRIIDCHGFIGPFDKFVDFFVNDELYYSPYWTYLKEVFEQKDHPNVHFVFFEDLKADPVAEVRRLDAFLGTRLTDDQITQIVNYTKFESMKSREASLLPQDDGDGTTKTGFNMEVIKKDGGFLRKGEVGGFKKKLTEEQEAKIDAWTLRNSGGLHKQLKYSI